MAFTRSMLKALGIEAEKIDEIMNAHIEVVDGLKEERDSLKESAGKLKDVQKELDDLKKDGGDWQKKYEKEHSDFDAFKTAQTAAEEKRTKDALYRELLRSQKVSEKRIDSIMKLTDLSGLKVKDGKLDDADKLTESIKTDWADFIVTEEQHGAGTDHPPGSDTPKDYEKMSMTEYAAARKKK